MRHKHVRNKFLRYIDGEMPEKEKQKIKLHLEGCEQCRKDVELLARAWNLSQPIKRPQPSPFLWNKISPQLGGESQKERLVHKAILFIRKTAQPALTAAVVALALFIGIQIGGRLITKNISSQQTAITTTQSQNEFGLDNFRVLSTNSLGSELAALMDYKK